MRPPKWRSAALGAFLLAALAQSAGAVGYHVASTGSGSNAGTINAPFRRISSANALVYPGDTVYVWSVNTADTTDYAYNLICPARSGASYLGGRIVYIGWGHLDDYGLHLPVPEILDTVSHVSILGFRVKGDATFRHNANSPFGTAIPRLSYSANAPKMDSISYCRLRNVSFCGSYNCVVAHNVIVNNSTTPVVRFLGNDCHDDADAECLSGDARCLTCADLNYFENNSVSGGTLVATGPSKGFLMKNRSQRNVVKDNDFTFTFSGSNPDAHGRYLYKSYSNTFTGNKWTFEANNASTGDFWAAFAMRDSSHHNSFVRDTMLCGLTSKHAIGGRFTNAGIDDFNGACHYARWDSCYYRTTYTMWLFDKSDNPTFRYSVFDCLRSPAIEFSSSFLTRGMKFTQNTVFTRSAGPAIIFGVFDPNAYTYALRNIYYADSVYNATEYLNDSCVAAPAAGTVSHYRDNMALSFKKNFDANLMWARAGRDSGVAKPYLACGTSNINGPVGPARCWSDVTGQEYGSLFGDPLFADTTWASFNPRFARGTLADSNDYFVDYAGALAPYAPSTPPDTTFDIDGSFVQYTSGGETYTQFTAVIQAQCAVVESLKVAMSCNGTAKDSTAFNAWFQSDSMAFTAVDVDTTYCYLGFKPTFYITKSLRGTPPPMVFVQTQVVDADRNRSAFAYRRVTFLP